MATFDVVFVYSGGDETLNFGHRLESGSALYQVDTVGTISTEKPVLGAPRCCACAAGSVVSVAANSNLSLFDDAGQSFLATLAFDGAVEVMACSDDGCFLAVGDATGTLHLIATAVCRILFSTEITTCAGDAGAFQNICFSPISEEGLCSLLVLATQSELFEFSNINLTQLNEAVAARDSELAQSVEQQIAIVRVDTSDVHTTMTHAAIFLSPDCILTCGFGETALCLWEKDDDEFVMSSSIPSGSNRDDVGLYQMALTSNEQYLFTLDSDRHLALWSTSTLICLRQWTETAVSDFLLQEAGNEDELWQHLLVVLLTSPVEGACHLSVCRLPQLTPVYQLQLNCHTTLVAAPSQQENVLVVEGAPSDDADVTERFPECISTLRIRCLNEAQPEARLSRLLNKKEFDEAESFAKLFKLDLELVYKTKVNYLLDGLSPWTEHNLSKQQSQDAFSDLKNCLSSITSDSHVVSCCTSATLASFEQTLDLLNFVRSRLQASLAGETEVEQRDSPTPALLVQVLGIIHRLGTFEVAFGISSFTAELWTRFLKCDILSECVKYLSHGFICTAVCLWNRHQSDVAAQLSRDALTLVLSSVPVDTPPAELTPWLNADLIPFILREKPQHIDIVINWIEKVARNMELLAKDGWPQNALEFATPEALAQRIGHMTLNQPQSDNEEQKVTCEADAYLQLNALVCHLHNLVSLHTRYSCRLSLAQYVQETTESLAYRMLDRVVAVELVPKTIAEVVRPYMKENSLQADRILYQYINDLAQRCKFVSYVHDAPREAKVIAVIDCIEDPDFKCRAISDAIMRACIPWSDAMQSLVTSGLALVHPRVDKLKEQCRLIQLRQMLMTYDLKQYNISYTSTAQALVHYILVQDRATSMQDALQVVNFYDHLTTTEAYVFRMQRLISDDRWEECVPLLESLSEDEAVQCGGVIVSGAFIRLDDQHVINEDETRRDQALHAKAACHTLKYMLRLTLTGWQRMECEDQLQYLMNSHILQKDSCTSQTEDFRGKMAVMAADAGDIATAVDLAHQLYEYVPTANTGAVLYKVACSLCAALADPQRQKACHSVGNLPALLHQFASQAATLVEPGLLADCVMLCEKTSLASRVSGQCQCEATDTHAQMREPGDMETKLKLGVMYKEHGLVMDAYTITTDLYLATIASPAKAGYVDALSDPVSSIIDYLRANGQNELALAYSAHYVRCVCLHTAIGDRNLHTTSQESDDPRRSVITKGISQFRDIVKCLLVKILSQTPADQHLAVSLLCSLPKGAAFDTLKAINRTFCYNYKKTHALALVAIELSTLYRDTKKRANYENLAMCALLAGKLGSECKIALDESFFVSLDSKKRLLSALCCSHSTHHLVIQQYCSTFSLNEEAALLSHLRYLLLPRDAATDTADPQRRPPGGATDTLTTQLERVTLLISEFKDVDQLAGWLSDMIAQLDPYDYERLNFILVALQKLGCEVTKELGLLDWLSRYKRVAAVSDYELEYRSSQENKGISIEKKVISSQSATRLPYHAFIDGKPWKVIAAELNTDTIPLWLPVVHLLQLSEDKVYITATNNMLRAHMAGGGGRVACPLSTPLLAQLRMLFNVSDKQMALACATSVMQRLTNGAEKLLAVQICRELAENWRSSCAQQSEEEANAQQVEVKLSTMWHQLRTEEVMRRHGLDEDGDLMTLAGQPVALVFQLYRHDSILRRSANNAHIHNWPDIHKVVDEISSLNSVDIAKIRLVLIEKWLPSSLRNKPHNPDETLNSTVCAEEYDDEDDEDNLKRVTYLMQNGSVEKNGIFLYAFAFTTKTSKRTTRCCVRALRCLFCLVDDDAIARITGKPAAQLRRELQSLLYICELDELQMSQTLAMFDLCSKPGLVKGIWRNHAHKPHAVKLVIELCIEYHIYDVDMWNKILTQLLKFEMTASLCGALERIAAVPQLWQVSRLHRIWMDVLLKPLLDAVPPVSAAQLQNCLQSLALLRRCPLLLDLDLSSFARHFLRLRLPACAAACAVLVPDTTARRTLLTLVSGEAVLAQTQLSEWTSDAGFTTAIVRQLLLDLQDTADMYSHDDS